MSTPNHDYEPPLSQTYTFAAVALENFTEVSKLPIFWGPDQFTNYPDYFPPNRWRYYEAINIPEVFRLIYGADNYDAGKWSDEVTILEADIVYFVDCSMFQKHVSYTNTPEGRASLQAQFDHIMQRYPPAVCNGILVGPYIVYGS